MTTETMLGAGTDTTEAATTTTTPEAPAATSLLTDGATEVTTATEPASPAAEGKPTEPAAVEGAPEKYEDFKAPEGQTIAPEVATEITALAKELNLTQDKAQKVVDTAMKLAAEGVKAQQQTLTALHTEWQGQVRADREIGGDKLNENLASAKAAMLATTTPQLQSLLLNSGLGNHPEVIRHFLKIAPAFAEAKHVTGDKSPSSTQSIAKSLYPNMA